MVNGPSTLGFIGLGTMGGRMCRNLARKSGRPVIGYDTVPERIADCAGAGVRAGASVSEVAAAERTGVDARGARLVEERFIEAIDKGYGHLYSPVIYRLFES